MVQINKTSSDIFAKQLAQFKKIFPQFISENKIDFDALQSFLDANKLSADVKDKYTFSWAGKHKSFQAISRPSLATLNPKKSESVDFNNSQNLFIEGDNLEVLKLLQANYHGKIKMIYIDPPYNTGKDFIYKDNFTQHKNDYFEQICASKNGIKLETNPDSNGRFHSDWLSMMYPRLFLAKQLLTDDGVIFVSIDDNEQHHLKMIMNEVFGEENFMAHICWNSTKSITNKALISVSHNTNFVYARNKDYFIENRKEFRLLEDGKGFENPDNDPRGKWKADPFQVGGWRPNQQYEIKNPNTEVIYLPNDNCSWKNDYNKFRELLNDNRIVFGKNGEGEPQRKRFLSEALSRGKVAKTWWDDVGTTTNGTKEIKKLFDSKIIFSNPKPISLLNKIMQLGDYWKNSIILDFFAGSATTGHAVMDLNQQDDGKRKFILVQIPESLEGNKNNKTAIDFLESIDKPLNIAEIGKERLRRAIIKHKFKDGFKVFNLALSNYSENQAYTGDNTDELLAQEKLLTNKPLINNYKIENLIYEVILKQGFSLNSSIKQDNDFYIITDTERKQNIYLTLIKTIATNTIEQLKLNKDDILVCFDSALTDTQKVNFSRNFLLRVI